jgi:hypothetical protein
MNELLAFAIKALEQFHDTQRGTFRRWSNLASETAARASQRENL